MATYDEKERVVTLIRQYNLILGRADLNASTEFSGETPGYWLGTSAAFRYTIRKSDEQDIQHSPRS